MKRFRFTFFQILVIGFAVGVLLLFVPEQAQAGREAQGQSNTFATVTYSDPINVRGGPSTVYYPVVGRLFPGDIVPALGVSPGHEWVQISYPQAPGGVAWVYATYVTLSGGDLHVVEPPPTSTPLATETINPTFAAAFIFQPTATRMPTFTPASPVDVPSYSDVSSPRSSGIAFGLILILFIVLGAIGYLGSLLLSRR